MLTLRADQFNIAALRGAADIIEEVDKFTTYLGFCQSKTGGTSEATWSIIKVVQSGDAYPIVTTFQYAEGLFSYSLVWENRAAYTYNFRKF